MDYLKLFSFALNSVPTLVSWFEQYKATINEHDRAKLEAEITTGAVTVDDVNAKLQKDAQAFNDSQSQLKAVVNG